MFDFFKKKPIKSNENIEEQDNILASITFFVSNKDQIPSIDVAIQDYSDDAIIAVCLLLKVITSDQGYLEAINMIKNGLIKDNREDILIEILTALDPDISKRLLDKTEKGKEPCIRPSDML
jgi:hypothetical protein